MEQMCISMPHQILRKGKMNSSEQWGPPLWKLFHMLAEQSGKQTDESLQRKESSLWAALISETKNITGCEACRLHVNHYIQTHPFMETSYDYLKPSVRHFFYEFHEYVNRQTLKPMFNSSLLTTMYTNLEEFESTFQQFNIQMELLIQSNTIKDEEYQQWLHHFNELSILCNIPNMSSV